MIANSVYANGDGPGATPAIRNVFIWGTSDPIPDVDVHCFDTEADMLEGWADFIRVSDPDVLMGYNSVNFDTKYLIGGSKNSGVVGRATGRARILGRLLKQSTTGKEGKEFRGRQSMSFGISGRIQYDVLQVVQKEFKLRYVFNFSFPPLANPTPSPQGL